MTKSLHEIWRPVVGYEGLYEVSSLGRVRSLARKDRRGRLWPERILKPGRDRGGYLQVGLSRDGCKTWAKVHRLVCEAFHGPAPEGKPHGLHGNHDPSDNRPENLRWGSNTENVQDKVNADRQARNKGEASGNAKLSEADVKAIQDEVLAGATRTAVAATYGLTQSTVGEIANGRRWAHIANPELQARLARRKRPKTLSDGEVLQVFGLAAQSLSQREVAARLGVDQTVIGRILRGDTPRYAALGARWTEVRAARAAQPV